MAASRKSDKSYNFFLFFEKFYNKKFNFSFNFIDFNVKCFLQTNLGVFQITSWVELPRLNKFSQFILPSLIEVQQNTNMKIWLSEMIKILSNRLNSRLWSLQSILASLTAIKVGILMVTWKIPPALTWMSFNDLKKYLNPEIYPLNFRTFQTNLCMKIIRDRA